MKRFLKLGILLAVFVMAGSAWATTINVPGEYGTINAALAAANPGDVILCAAGTYNEHVVITVADLQLLGPNAGVDARNACHVGSARGPEAIIDGCLTDAAVVIQANNVVVDGFTIQRGANGGFQSGVWMGNSYSGMHVLNNIITGNSMGIFANCNGASLIYRNWITANNEPGAAGGSGIYSENTNSLTVDENEFSGHINNNPVIFAATGLGAHTGLQFTENNVHDTYGLYVLAASGAFTGNQFNGALGFTALAFGGGCAGVDVLNNFFSIAARGVRIKDDGYGFGNNSDIELHLNSFSGLTQYTVGYISGYVGTLDASNNWWGTNVGATIVAGLNQTGGTINYSPWLASGDELVPNTCDGFQTTQQIIVCDVPNPVTVNVDDVCQCLEACAGVPLTVYFTPLTIDQRPIAISLREGCDGGDLSRENEILPIEPCPLPYDEPCPPAYPTQVGDFFYDEARGGWGIVIIARENGCFCICIDEYLPVELIGFDAVAGDGSVSLSWTTASETDNAYFDILREDAMVGRMNAGNSPSGNHYTWTDSNLNNGREYNYSLVAVSLDGIRETIGTVSATPTMNAATITEYALHQNYPNPFNPETNIIFDIVEAGNVSLTVYNPLGQTIATLVNGTVQSGRHTVTFDGTNLTSGLYYYRLEAGDFSAVKKMILMK